MLKGEIRTLAQLSAQVTECPLWDPVRQRLHFVEIYARRIHTVDWATGARHVIETPEPVASLGLAQNGLLVAGLSRGVALVDPDSGACTPLASIDEGPANRLNDGRCDPDGRFFWVGSMVEALDRPGGTLYRVSPDGVASPMVPGLICSNGLAWSPDGATMFHADSRLGTVFAYDYAGGEISNRRVFAVAAPGEGRPDGAAMDDEGCYWVARYDGWRIVRHAPDGRELFVLPVPVQNPTMCGFAGEGLRTLVFTSARGSLSAAELAGQPLAGSVFAVEVGVAGLPEPRFRA